MPRSQITLTSLTGSYVNEVDDVVVNGNNINLSGSLILSGAFYIHDIGSAPVAGPNEGVIYSREGNLYYKNASGLETPFGSGAAASSTFWNAKVPPTNPHAKDDEFDDEVLDAKWSEFDPPGILTVTENTYGLELNTSNDPAASTSIVGIYQPVPTEDEFEIVAKISISGNTGNFSTAAIFVAGDIVTNPATAPILANSIRISGNGLDNLEALDYPDRTSSPAALAAIDQKIQTAFLAIQWKESTGKACFWYSFSGVDWTRLGASEYDSSYLNSADYFGIYVNGVDQSCRGISEFFRVRSAASGIISTAPLSQGARVNVSISSTATGGGGSESFFSSTTNGSAFTTGSIAIRGSESGVDSPADKGADVFFYVSGSSGSAGGNVPGVAVFGGDVRVSGSLLVGAGTTIIDQDGIRTSNVSGPRISFEGNKIKFQDTDRPLGRTLDQMIRGLAPETQVTGAIFFGSGGELASTSHLSYNEQTKTLSSENMFVTGNIYSSAIIKKIKKENTPGGGVNVDIEQGDVWYFDSPTGNMGVNFANVPSAEDRMVSMTISVIQGATPRSITSAQVNGSAVTIKWKGGSAPSPSANEVSLYRFDIQRINSSWLVLGWSDSFSS